MRLPHWLGRAADAMADWQRTYGPVPDHPSTAVDERALDAALGELVDRLRGSYPFFHPRYAGQMLKPPHPVAVVGYVAAMLVNSNNHALEGGPATSRLEEEVMAQLAALWQVPEALGHLTTSGTLANLEALYVARESHPGRGIAHSADAHYTHARMCQVLGMEAHAVPVDARGRMDTDALAETLASGRIGTVVATTGTTSLGAVDPLHTIVALARRHGARVHVDAAYGGFHRLLAEPGIGLLNDLAPWQALSTCDSLAVDPHKHGLQPYGCGAVLFADPEVARYYGHDSPYTYYSSPDRHLGQISLECSRSGAAAAALWLTLKLFPLTPGGLGAILAAGRRAALDWAGRIERSSVLELYQRPDLDIVTYLPRAVRGLDALDRASRELARRGAADPEDPVFLSLVRVTAEDAVRRHPRLARDSDGAHILRSVLMKPEVEAYVPRLHRRVEELVGGSAPTCPPRRGGRKSEA